MGWLLHFVQSARMNLFFCGVFLLALGSLAQLDQHHGYRGYKVYRLTVQTQQQVDFCLQKNSLLKKEMLDGEVEFWSDIAPLSPNSKQPILVMVSPAQQSQFLAALDKESIQHEVTIADVAIAIEEESRLSPEDQKAIDNSGMTWTAYHRYGTIEAYLESLHRNYPDLVQEKTIIGRSYEGRNIHLLKIGKARPDGKTKPAIWIDSKQLGFVDIHAREWISSATVTFMINRLVTEYETNSTCRRMLDEIDWYFLPVINVDGFEFTHAAPYNRQWRKTRRVNPFSMDIGADPNRNYDYKWMVSGSVQNARDDLYAGAYPFSEIENLFLTDALLARRKQIKASLSFHSYYQLWLMPWAYGSDFFQDEDDLRNVGLKATAALKSQYGTEYKVGTVPELLYSASGGGIDWAYAKAGIKYSYTPELRDNGTFGFILPPNQIIPSGRETFEAINVIAEVIFAEFGPTLD